MKSCPGFTRLFVGVLVTAFVPVSLSAACLTPLGVSLSEVRLWDGPGPVGRYLEPLVEIYNGGPTAASVSGWSLRGATGNVLATLPSLSLPARCHLVVHFGTGTADANFADSLAHHFTNGDSVGVLGNLSGAVALYDGSNAIRDFVAWSSTGTPPSGTAYSAAVSAGRWPAGAIAYQPDSIEMLYTIRRVPQGFTHSGRQDLDWIHQGWSESQYAHLTAGRNALQRGPQDGRGFEADSAQTLVWCPVDWARAYHLEVVAEYDSSEAVLLDRLVVSPDTSVALPFGSYRWSVAAVDSCGELNARTWWRFSVDTASASLGAQALKELKVSWLPQRKDSKLLCIWDQAKRTMPACTFELGAAGPWDDTHPFFHATTEDASKKIADKPKCPHCSMHCARATIQMINNFFRGNKDRFDVAADNKAMTQDHISVQLRIHGDPRDASPEGDLGHAFGGGFGGQNDNSARATLAWAVLNSQVTGTVVNGTLTYNAVKAEIDAGSPIAVTNVAHMFLFDGYEDAHQEIVNGKKVKVPDQIRVVDPWPGQKLSLHGWMDAAKILPKIFATWSIRKAGQAALAGREEDAAVWENTDFDRIVDFDEGLDPNTKKLIANAPRAFQTDKTSRDTDGDFIEDYWEIVYYTFHKGHHGNHNPGADPDVDKLRAENDLDSDDDRDADGNEDTNQDGNYEPQRGETCVLDKNSNTQKVKLKKKPPGAPMAFLSADNDSIFLPGDQVMLEGDLYAENHVFRYFVYNQCPMPLLLASPYPTGAALVDSGSIASNSLGELIPVNLGQFPPGCYSLALDAQSDGLYGYQTIDPLTGEFGAGVADTVIQFVVVEATGVGAADAFGLVVLCFLLLGAGGLAMQNRVSGRPS
jgi:hypothetical protein